MTTPVPLVLQLWSIGHSGSQIAEMVGIDRRGVERIVEHAREIGDARAVIHASISHQPTGNRGKVVALLSSTPDLKVVPLIGKTVCKNGHAMTPENTGHQTAGRRCRTCHNLRSAQYRRERK